MRSTAHTTRTTPPTTKRRRYPPGWIFREWCRGCTNTVLFNRPSWRCWTCTRYFLAAFVRSCLTPWTWTPGPERCGVCDRVTPADELRHGECVDCSH